MMKQCFAWSFNHRQQEAQGRHSPDYKKTQRDLASRF
jgi:hypothetical protein